MPVIIDPRRHDAVLFEAALDSAQTLIRQLREAGVGVGFFSPDALSEAADEARPSPLVRTSIAFMGDIVNARRPAVVVREDQPCVIPETDARPSTASW